MVLLVLNCGVGTLGTVLKHLGIGEEIFEVCEEAFVNQQAGDADDINDVY